MKTFRYFIAIFILFILSGCVFALDFVLPGTFDGNTLVLYPNIATTVGFLKVESGVQVFVDTINCETVSCGPLKASGPYYVFDVLGTNKSGKITVNYHLKGSEQNLKNIITITNTDDALTVLVFLPTDAKFFQKTEAKVLIVNNSDVKLTGQVGSNFPEAVFLPVNFDLDAKTKKEYTTYFFPKNPGYYELIYTLNVDGTNEKKEVGRHTVNIARELKDFLSMPTKSYFPTNPIMSLYSSIIYFISLLA